MCCKPIFRSAKVAQKGKNCSRLLELQKVAPNAKSCSKAAKHNRDRPIQNQMPCRLRRIISRDWQTSVFSQSGIGVQEERRHFIIRDSCNIIRDSCNIFAGVLRIAILNKEKTGLVYSPDSILQHRNLFRHSIVLHVN